MANQNNHIATARAIASFLNDQRLAFKTYSLKELDEIYSNTTGDHTNKISNETVNPDAFEDALMELGFVVFPALVDAIDDESQVRVYRAGSIVSKLLTAVRHPDTASDTQLASFLIQLNKLRMIHEDENERASA